jgi:hypothetical protein
MSTSLTVTANRGLLLPVYGVTAATISSASSITQAGPLAGVPVPQQVTEATLQTIQHGRFGRMARRWEPDRQGHQPA